MCLNKFNAGPDHNMRFGKSYLKAHSSCESPKPNTRQKCGDAPKPITLQWGLSHLPLFPLSGAFGRCSQGLWIPSWFYSVFVEHTCFDIPTPYTALRAALRLAICTVRNPPACLNTRSLVLGYWWSTCPGGPALWYCTLLSVGWSVLLSCEKSFLSLRPPYSHFSVVWRAFLLPLPHRSIRLHHTATPCLAGTLSASSAGTLPPLTIAGPSSTAG